jgi:5S rRNA maturation endonuclease (ribonuclease M5)
MDVLALHEAGITNAISVPNGATLNTNNLDYLDSCIDYFEDKEKIILAVDSDEAGQALQAELIRRLGSEVCYITTFEDCKDANEYLLKTLLRSEISRMKSLTLLGMVSSLAFKLVYRTLMISFLRILVNLLLSLEYLLQGSRISWIKWLLGITQTTVGKQLLHLQRMYRHIYTLIN